jgi:hypothetical protein
MDELRKAFPGATENSRTDLADLNNQTLYIADKRVAQLLLVLHELDESVAGLEDLPRAELSELVANAILGCGFADPVEARYAISAVLKMIESQDFVPDGS